MKRQIRKIIALICSFALLIQPAPTHAIQFKGAPVLNKITSFIKAPDFSSMSMKQMKSFFNNTVAKLGGLFGHIKDTRLAKWFSSVLDDIKTSVDIDSPALTKARFKAALNTMWRLVILAALIFGVVFRKDIQKLVEPYAQPYISKVKEIVSRKTAAEQLKEIGEYHKALEPDTPPKEPSVQEPIPVLEPISFPSPTMGDIYTKIPQPTPGELEEIQKIKEQVQVERIQKERERRERIESFQRLEAIQKKLFPEAVEAVIDAIRVKNDQLISQKIEEATKLSQEAKYLHRILNSPASFGIMNSLEGHVKRLNRNLESYKTAGETSVEEVD